MDSPLILLVIPQNRFCSQELFGLKEVLIREKVQCRILSKTGKEAKGEDKSFIQPDGMLVDWNRYLQGRKKYDAVIVIGGKGSKISIWEDPILPQILTDHFRAGKNFRGVWLISCGASACWFSFPMRSFCHKR